MSETPCAKGAAFHELLAVARATFDDRWLAALDPETRSAFDARPDAVVPDDRFCAALEAATDAHPELARAVGRARAEAIVSPRVAALDGDPFRFLKEGASSFYEGRTTYGATSVEVLGDRAILRMVAPERFARRPGEGPNPGPTLAAAFLGRGLELVSGLSREPRYNGPAPRIDERFDRPMVNLLFEFELDSA